MTYEHQGDRPYFHVFPTNQGRAEHTLASSLRWILTQFRFEIDIAEDHAEIEVLIRLRRGFLLSADLYASSRDLLPFNIEFDDDLMIPFSEMIPGSMSEAEIAELDNSPLHVIITAPPANAEELERMTTDASYQEAAIKFQNELFTATRMSLASAPSHGPSEPAISVLAAVATNTAPLPASPTTPPAVRVQPQRTHRPTVGPDFVTPLPRQPRAAAAVPQPVPQTVTAPSPLGAGPPLRRVAGTVSLVIGIFGTREEATEALHRVQGKGQTESSRRPMGPNAPMDGNQYGTR